MSTDPETDEGVRKKCPKKTVPEEPCPEIIPLPQFSQSASARGANIASDLTVAVAPLDLDGHEVCLSV